MEKLVFDCTICEEPDCWDITKPFEYESKEQFILDVIDNPFLITKLGMSFNDWDDIPEYVENIDQYVFTLEEWFNKNKVL